MSGDNANPVPSPAHAALDRLPGILRVTAARVQYAQPKAYIAAESVNHAEAGIQVDVHTDDELIARAAAPVLYVGGHALTESERVGPKHYRFHGLTPEAQLMKKGDVLQLGWTTSPRVPPVRPVKALVRSRGARVTLPAIKPA